MYYLNQVVTSQNHIFIKMLLDDTHSLTTLHQLIFFIPVLLHTYVKKWQHRSSLNFTLNEF